MEEVVPGLTAGLISTILCNPLDTLRINYQLNNKLELKFKYLYRGVSYGLIAIPSFWTIYFPFYKKLKEEEIPKPVAAYMSCCIASTFTTPFWVLRQCLQTGKEPPKMSVFNFYRGLIPTYIMNLSFLVQIPTYEYLKSKTNNNTFNTFLNVSVSKTFATCIFYPFDTIRAKIRNEESFKSIRLKEYYRGINIYLLRSIPYHTSIFCTYEFIKNLM